MFAGEKDAGSPKTWEEFRLASADRKRPLVIAHRGTPRELPENTLASFSNALRQGANVLETDLRITRDGSIVLLHDETLDRTTDGSGRVSAHRLGEIKQLRTLSPLGGYLDESIPTLVELLSMTQASVPLLLELKDPLFAEEKYARELIRILKAYGMLDKAAVVSFKSELIESVTGVCPLLPSGMITLNKLRPIPGTALLGPLWPLLIINPFYVMSAHRMGSIVAPLDTSPEKRMWYYLLLGVDAVLADSPRQAIAAMGHVV